LSDCGKGYVLLDIIEKKFDSRGSRERLAKRMLKLGRLDNESIAIDSCGHAFSIVGEAGHIFRRHQIAIGD